MAYLMTWLRKEEVAGYHEYTETDSTNSVQSSHPVA